VDHDGVASIMQIHVLLGELNTAAQPAALKSEHHVAVPKQAYIEVDTLKRVEHKLLR
jgi:hypothetical protein